MTSSSRDTAAPNKPAVDYEALIERLEEIREVYIGRGALRTERVNPDGPEAATAIRDLLARAEEIVEKARQITEELMLTHGDDDPKVIGVLGIAGTRIGNLARHLTQGETDVA